jgi:hypothetical protein
VLDCVCQLVLVASGDAMGSLVNFPISVLSISNTHCADACKSMMLFRHILMDLHL